MIQMTTEEIAQKMNLKKEVVYKLVSFMEEAEIIKAVGTRRKEGAKGAGAKVYEVDPVDVDKRFQTLIGSLAGGSR